MEYRPFGQTGLDVSVLGFGAMRIPDKPEDEVAELLNRALDLGITYIDTAPGYGNSEELIGKALGGRDTSGVVFSTKTNSGSDPDADSVCRRVEQSLERMQIPHISVLQMWGINDPEVLAKILAKGGPLEGARKCQEQGLVKHVGFTTHALTPDALKVIETGEFVSMTGRYHHLDPVYDDARKRALELGMAFVAMTPLGQGWLARPSDSLREALGEYDPVDFALRYAAGVPGVTTLIVGISHMSELDAAYHAIGADFGDVAALAAKGDQLRRTIRDRLGADYCTGCRKCLPCPENINIPELLRLNNLHKAYDLDGWVKDRYKFMGNAGNWYPGVKADNCTECGECEPRCPENIEIIRLLKNMHEEHFEGERGRLSNED